MSSTPRDLFDFSKSLVEAATTECGYRAAASRAYYSAFHSFVPIAEILPPTSADAVGRRYLSHGELINRLERWSPGGRFAALARLKVSAGAAWRVLQAARAERERADYELKDHFSVDNARQQVARASRLLQLAQQLSSEIAKIP